MPCKEKAEKAMTDRDSSADGGIGIGYSLYSKIADTLIFIIKKVSHF